MARVDHVALLVERLERAILAGEYAPGDQLPSERDLAAERGVSRSVVREALNRLASIGLVRSQHGSGTRVESPSRDQVSATYQRLISLAGLRQEHLAEVRLPLETAIAARAALVRTDDHLERLEETQRILGNPRRSLEAHVQADLQFHGILAEATGNPLFGQVLAPIQQLLIESRRRTLGRFGSELAHDHHARILDAVRRQNPADASAEMRIHLETNFAHLRDLDGASPPPD